MIMTIQLMAMVDDFGDFAERSFAELLSDFVAIGDEIPDAVDQMTFGIVFCRHRF